MTNVVNSKMIICQSSVQEYTAREETLNGREYLAVPVTMMVEGVHQGSHGALLHTAEELGKIPESWNGIPVTIGHPVVDGKPVSANSPEILQVWAVGIVFNTTIKNTSLKSEAWFEKEKLKTLNENLYNRIVNGEIVEVSVGVFSEDEIVEGTWHNEQYVAVARNLRPDHLAILPNQTGACSVEDGCGLRTNSNNMKINDENRLEVLQQLKQQGYVVSELTVNESLLQRIEKVRSKVYAMDAEKCYYYVEDMDNDWVIYNKNDHDESKLYKQGYAMAADGSVEFVGNPIQVQKKIEYETVTNNNTVIKRTRKFTNFKKEEQNMSDEKCTPCVKTKVNALIANAATAYAEDDREWLETLEENQLDRMVPKTVEPTVIEKQGVITPEMAVNALRDGLKTDEDYIKIMPTNMQEQTRSALRLFQERKESLIAGIIANTDEGTWTKEELTAYEVEKLEKIAKTAGVKAATPQVNYSGMNAGGDLHNNGATNEVEPMAPAGITFNN